MFLSPCAFQDRLFRCQCFPSSNTYNYPASSQALSHSSSWDLKLQNCAHMAPGPPELCGKKVGWDWGAGGPSGSKWQWKSPAGKGMGYVLAFLMLRAGIPSPVSILGLKVVLLWRNLSQKSRSMPDELCAARSRPLALTVAFSVILKKKKDTVLQVIKKDAVHM